ncbi:MAG TPA: FHA domain-containing protein [Fimbriimonadaceae bacterium]|nr:FHA domain-containing protein [Fimbriimonadaceae bacterium]
MADDQTTVATEMEEVESPVDAEDETSESGEEASEATQATLTIKRSGAETSDVFVFQPPAIIGRFDPAVGPIDVDLGQLPEGNYVSRKHATIVHEDGAWKIRDLGSSNGTFILRDDFERIEESELADGDEIALGNARMVFRTQEKTA